MNLPIYRAKKECDGEYIEFKTYFEEDGKYRAIIKFAKQEVDGWLDSVYIPLTFRIDPTTLAIHFPDMIDSQSIKIFASLSEDGRGGDIVTNSETSIGLTAVYKNGNFNFVSFPLDNYKNATHAETYSSCIAFLRFDHKGKINYHRKSKVIGIQK